MCEDDAPNNEEVYKYEKGIQQARIEHQLPLHWNDMTIFELAVRMVLFGMVLFECFSILCWCFPCVLLLSLDDPICQMVDYMPFSIQFMYKGWAILPQSWYGMFFLATFGVTVYLNPQ